MVFRKMAIILATIIILTTAIAPATAAIFIIVGTQNPNSVGLATDQAGASNIANAIGLKTAQAIDTRLDTEFGATEQAGGNIVIIVGGNNANSVAMQLVNAGIIGANQLDEPMPGKYFTVTNAWGPGTADAVIVSGSDRYATRNAAKAYATAMPFAAFPNPVEPPAWTP